MVAYAMVIKTGDQFIHRIALTRDELIRDVRESERLRSEIVYWREADSVEAAIEIGKQKAKDYANGRLPAL
jgi:hypothetical protein